jgi:sugar diacid utilization regulator
MTDAIDRVVGQETVLREQLASFRPLLALSIVMTSIRDETEILRIATTAVPSLGGCRAEVAHLDGDWRVVGSRGRPANLEDLQAQLAAFHRHGGLCNIEGCGWAWAYPLVSVNDMAGHLVVSRDTEPEAHHQFLLSVLVQQTGAALVNAGLHARERASAERERKAAARERVIADELRTTNVALQRAVTELARSSEALQQNLDIHHRFTAVTSAGDRQEGIARALHELTGLPVAIEDRHGNLTAWAGPGQPEPYPKPTPARREHTLARALDAGGPVRDRDRLISVAQPGSEVLGVIAFVDPNRTADNSAKVALEYATTVLTLELTHLRALAETELRLRRDLVEELLAGTDPQGAQDRARALGYDLARPHRVIVVTTGSQRNGSQRVDYEAFYDAVRRAVRTTEVGSLLAARPGGVAVLCDTDLNWEQFRAAIVAQLGSAGSCRIGVGGRCIEPPEFPLSHRQAELALKLQVAIGGPDQATVFGDLGIYKLLSELANTGTVEEFIRRWLGALLDYDAAKGAQLVETLSCYLECGGNYDLTAAALSLHRSTLRYRLQRIREMSSHDLQDSDIRFNLQLATRAWKTVHAMRQQPHLDCP